MCKKAAVNQDGGFYFWGLRRPSANKAHPQATNAGYPSSTDGWPPASLSRPRTAG